MPENKTRIKPLVWLLWMIFPLRVLASGESVTTSHNFEFDNSMLIGSAKNQNILARFDKANAIAPGKYQVDIFINGNFYNRQSLVFAAGKQDSVSPCFSRELLIAVGVRPDSIQSQSDHDTCLKLAEQVQGASAQFDFSRLRLDMLIPQAQMVRTARGAVPLEDLSAGETAFFTNYDTNFYRTRASGDYNSDSTYLGLLSGLNLGLWQLRQLSNYTRYTTNNGPDSSHWKSIRTYLQRPLPGINSELTLGDSYTSGNFFSSLGFLGVQLETDDRMVPESQRGYAPTIRGIASTTAKVTVSQSGTQIYQTTVAPGAFVIDDLYPTSYEGDLVVEVQEADGRISSFTVPFAAVPGSMRPGRSHASFSAGQVRDIGNSDDMFADLTWQTGLTNALTASSGVRISDGYQAVLGGAVFASELGALGINAVYSHASMPGESLNGWRFGASYSRTFVPTSTTLALAGYRYSTQGYRDLSDVLGIRNAEESGSTWTSSTYQQRNQFVVTLSQGLGQFGQAYVSGCTSTYRGGRGRDTQYQVGYSNHFGSLSYNLSLSRQKTGRTQYGVQDVGVNEDDVNSSSTENIFMLSLSLPLGAGSRSPVLSSGYSHQSGRDGHDSYQSSLTGTLGETQNTAYSLNAAYDNQGGGTSEGASLTQQLPVATLGGSFSHGKDYSQYGASARGAAVVHSVGVTFGPYLSDTFALVEAKGASGAEVNGGMGSTINGSGYALVPSIVPYSFNDITLNASGIDNPNAELVENQQRIAAYSGAVVKVRFKTLEGYALLIKLKPGAQDSLPLGADVYDDKNSIVGLVGQGNQIYARAASQKGALRVKWGDTPDEMCLLHYDLQGLQMNQSMYHLTLPCRVN
ncbi:fimbria/pilus outer membrane usher protein [Pseudenterobacter timonensis]